MTTHTHSMINGVRVELTPEEIAQFEAQASENAARKDAEQAKRVRAERNAKLAETDWVVIKAMENGVAVSAAIATYRQALRDISAQAGFPWAITWPDAP